MPATASVTAMSSDLSSSVVQSSRLHEYTEPRYGIWQFLDDPGYHSLQYPAVEKERTILRSSRSPAVLWSWATPDPPQLVAGLTKTTAEREKSVGPTHSQWTVTDSAVSVAKNLQLVKKKVMLLI